MKLKPVPAKTGLLWVRQGITTFVRQPLALSGLFFIFMLLMSVAVFFTSMKPTPYRPLVLMLNDADKQLAIEALKKGHKVARRGWNGKGMWLVLVPGTPTVELREGTPYAKALPEHSHCEILPHIDMWTTNSEGRRAMLCGWLASQTDMLSDDWEIVQ